MKIIGEIEQMLAEQFLPKSAKVGKTYKKVLVDGETFKDLKLDNINPNTSELFFSSKDGKHTFNYVEQEVILK